MGGLWARRRVILGVTLCILVIVLAVIITRPWRAASPSTTSRLASPTVPKPTATWRPTYSIVPEGPFATTAHPGDRLTYRWDAQADATPTSYAPGAFTCTFALYGPYATETDADRASQTDLSTATPAVAAPPLTLNRWTSQTQSETLTLPQSLAPGYYVAEGRVVESDGPETRTTTDIIQIVG